MLVRLQHASLRVSSIANPFRNVSAYRKFCNTPRRSSETARSAEREVIHAPNPTVFVAKLPRTKTRLAERYGVAQQLFELGSKYGKMHTVRTPMTGEGIAYLDFETTADAVNMVQSAQAEPIQLFDKDVVVNHAARGLKPLEPELVNSSELILRYKPATIAVEEARQILTERFPEASVTTNVKRIPGYDGAFFLKFADAATAKTAAVKQQEHIITFAGQTVVSRVHPEASTDLYLFNLPRCYDRKELEKLLAQFGELKVIRHSFTHLAPHALGSALVSYQNPESARALFETTLNENLLLDDDPVRSHWTTIHDYETRKRPKITAPSPSGDPLGI